ncbi:hypothetical protein [Xanthomonas vesicatoria]|uniref:hypothetical protein n=1 Tax=Xanthomonas vesicatoria TaxID=56460 RepID=UPI000F8EA3F0|nr:hypothetical protein [Xanthomonas vesicatoria]MCC8560090.1 hypothetical protein [Xanthomonas vesicatoria]MCC8602552.1 hypothetical protein [Xanthomonas vesicatoria]MCC8611057.1 hypothetical protein [Xanthomonas vesicatoria]MCC8675224.1 hypothetical protein [Xanthomonas vesicatoria]MCC8679567.1 hypothetical protein [Xanthomonas vesicatoria]
MLLNLHASPYPHPALRATFSRWEKDKSPSPDERRITPLFLRGEKAQLARRWRACLAASMGKGAERGGWDAGTVSQSVAANSQLLKKKTHPEIAKRSW